MSQNRVVIFSNGIADFQRTYAAKKGPPTEISIPVRKDHIADVLASLNVYGDVLLTRPPSFRPSNESAGNLSIDPQRALEDLATKLSGAKVVVEKPGGSVEGVLVGLHTEPEGKLEERIFPKSLIVMAEQGLVRIALKEIQKLRFPDATIQTEIDKSLQRSVERIKPNSTFVDLAVTTEQDEAEVVLHYTVPAAAWKISYRLRETDGGFEFQGFAIVDNNTDEDWKDFLVSVVTGEPITFSTDLADSKIPRRSHVNVVRGMAIGAVEVEEAIAMGGAAASMLADVDEPSAPLAGSVMRKSLAARGRPLGGRAVAMAGPSAAAPEAEVREVGDFCVFESQSPVSIGSNRSAVIPVFQTDLGKAKTVLHYKRENHEERPFRAIEFTNETPQSLGRGVCTIYQDGIYAGSCIMPATRPGGDALLPHALATGVRIWHERKKLRSKTVGIRLSEGFCHTSLHQKQDILYRVKNLKDESFNFLLDHDFVLDEPDVKCSLHGADGKDVAIEPKERLKNGIRLAMVLAPKSEIVVTVSEARTELSSVELVNVNSNIETIKVGWLEQNLVVSNGPLANEPGIRKCLDLQRSLDQQKQKIADAVNETERLIARQDRLRKNISTGGHDDQTAQWRTDLGKAENDINEREERTIPKLRDEEKAIREELRTALMSLSAEWKGE